MEHHYLPTETNKAYTPIGVRNLIVQAEKENGGDLEAVLSNKHKYKNLIEMYHASFLVLALYKKYGPEFQFSLAEGNDPPDLYFIQNENIGQGAIPVEVMELYKHGNNFPTQKELIEHIWKKKGSVDYKKCHLFLSSRMGMKNFNVTKFVQEIKKLPWKFERIWLSIFTKQIMQWTFFEVFPPAKYNDKSFIYFNLHQDKKFWY